MEVLSPTAEEPLVQGLENLDEDEPPAVPTYSIPPPSMECAALMKEPSVPILVPSQERSEESKMASQLAAPAAPQVRRTSVEPSRRSVEAGIAVYAPTRERNPVLSKDSIRYLDGPEQQRRQKVVGQELHRAGCSPLRLAVADSTSELPPVITGRRYPRGSVESVVAEPRDSPIQTTIAKLMKSVDSPIIPPEEGARSYYSPELSTKILLEVATKDSTKYSEGLLQQAGPRSIALGPRQLERSEILLCKSRPRQSISSDEESHVGHARAPSDRGFTGSTPSALDLGHTHAKQLRQRQATQSMHIDNSQSLQDRSTSRDDSEERHSNVSERSGADRKVSGEPEMYGFPNKQGAGKQTPKPGNENDDNPLKALVQGGAINNGECDVKQQAPKTPIQTRVDRLPRSAVKAIAAKFESASQEAVFVPSPTYHSPRHGGIISQYTVNPSPTARGKSATRLGWGSKLDSINRSITSGPSVALNQGSSVSPAIPWGERSVTGNEVSRTIVNEGEEDNGSWVRRFLPLLGRDELDSRTTTEAAKGHPQVDTSILFDDGRLVSTTPHTLPRRRGHFSESERDADQTLPRKARAMSFPHLAAPQHRPQDTKTLNSSNATKDASPDVVLRPIGKISTLSRGHMAKNLTVQAQMRSLQNQVAAKTEEARQLRQLLEAKRDADTVLLREQLRLIGRDREFWRERAEKAEKRVAAFERVASRMKRLSDNMPMKGEASIPGVDGKFGTSELHAGELETQAARMCNIERWLE